MGNTMGWLVLVLVLGLVACGGNHAAGTAVCGDGIVDASEACDDGTLNGTAGCTVDCAFTCADPATDCAAAPACHTATCTVEHTCLTVPDASLDATPCGTDLVCNNGSCVSSISPCGNGVVDAAEQCDFGVDNGNGTGCEADCTFSCTTSPDSCDDSNPCNGAATCGSITVPGTGQKCAAGTPQADGTACGTAQICINTACTAGVCGDSFVTTPEECDDANQAAGDGCTNGCRFSCLSTDSTRNCTPADVCAGQGTCNDTTHTCAPGTPLADNTPCGTGDYCKTGVCTQPMCGDGTVEPGETCDDGALNGTVGSGCKTDCTYVCVNPATDCGTQPACERWSCTAAHTCLAVADSTQNGMTCGTGLVCNNGSCASPAAVCGNGISEAGEQCDFGLGNGPGTGCEANCTFSCTILPNSCNDGDPCNGAEMCGAITVPGVGQKCFAGTPLADNSACGTNQICKAQVCTASVCGDSYVDAGRGETCEPPSTSTCDAACHLIVCGDGVRAGTEQCDDGNTTNIDGCDATCKFEQCQRINSLAVQFNTNPYCTKNALGGAATGSISRNAITDAINAGIGDGSITIMFHALGLDDLSGTNDPALNLGVLSGAPQTGSGYSGTNDLDWWYTTDATTLTPTRTPVDQIPASIAAKVINAGPADFSIAVNFVGTPVTLNLLAARFRATIGTTSTPLVSTGSPPGHLAAEHLDPALASYATMTGADWCGNTTADSLANVQMPSVLVGCGFGKCTQCYTTTNTLLDLYISGCNVFLVGQQIKATQPDTARNPLDVYQFTANAQHVVTSCTKNGGPATLADCLANAAYTSFFKFTTDRVIPK